MTLCIHKQAYTLTHTQKLSLRWCENVVQKKKASLKTLHSKGRNIRSRDTGSWWKFLRKVISTIQYRNNPRISWFYFHQLFWEENVALLTSVSVPTHTQNKTHQTKGLECFSVCGYVTLRERVWFTLVEDNHNKSIIISLVTSLERMAWDDKCSCIFIPEWKTFTKHC